MKLSVERTNEWIRYAAAAGIYFLVMVAAYINMGQDMGAEYFLPGSFLSLLSLCCCSMGRASHSFRAGCSGRWCRGCSGV